MKRFFYVTFDSLNFALAASISFCFRVAGAQGGAGLGVYMRPWPLICTAWSQKWWRRGVFVEFVSSAYIYVFGIQRVKVFGKL